MSTKCTVYVFNAHLLSMAQATPRVMVFLITFPVPGLVPGMAKSKE